MIRDDVIINTIKKIRSGIIHIEFFLDKQRIGSGTGFFSNGYLITNHHVWMMGNTQKELLVKLSWQSEKLVTSRETITISNKIFQDSLISGSPKNNYDYAILNIPSLRSKSLYEFNLENPDNYEVGDEGVILGFPFEHSNLVCHKAMISSFFISKNNLAEVIQLDASVNNSNSGGPLVNPTNGNVIAIVTRKGTGLTTLFDKLLESYTNNIHVLKQVKGMMKLGNVDPVDVMVKGQIQMQVLAKEIERSANVGIGYAFSIKHVFDEIKYLKTSETVLDI